MPTYAILAAARLASGQVSGHVPVVAAAAAPPTKAINCLRFIALVTAGWAKLSRQGYHIRETAFPRATATLSPRPILCGQARRYLIAVRYFDDAGAGRQRIDQRIRLGLVCSVE